MSVYTDIQRKLWKVYDALSLEHSWPTLTLDDIPLERPKQDEYGDYATPLPLRVAKQTRQQPLEVAQLLADGLKSSDIIETAEVAPPGFVNIRLEDDYLRKQISTIFKKGADYFQSAEGEAAPVVIEYSSPNIAKPFGIGHLRSTIIGAALANAYEALGYAVIHENHLGDWGTQFGRVIDAWQRWGDETAFQKSPIDYLYDLYVRHNQESEENPELIESARSWFKKLEDGDKQARELWWRFREESWNAFREIYRTLGVADQINHEHGEAFYEDRLPGTLADLEKKGLVTKSEGALIVDLEKLNLPPLMLQKSDGGTTYALRDLAAAQYRQEEYHPIKALYEVGNEQTLHFQQLFATLKLAGFDWADTYVHVKHGQYRFPEGTMSSRRGNIIRMDDLIDEARKRVRKIVEEKNPDAPEKDRIVEVVALGAIKFNDLAQHRETDIVFDWDKVLNTEGDSGPYLQYTYARLKSILRKADVGLTELTKRKNTVHLFEQSEERVVANLLYRLPEAINAVARDYEPHHIAVSLIEIARAVNAFYHQHPVLKAPDGVREARLLLVAATAETLKQGLALLGIEVVEEI